MSPVLLIGKILYQNLCDIIRPWDREIPKAIESQWLKWIENVNIKVDIPRYIKISRKSLASIDIHIDSLVLIV